ncbi:MAG TPA: sialidase family protein [Acidimicrobiales bacterium]|nr:sialidase family protein [Acidimicrobiales bacterium]
MATAAPAGAALLTTARPRVHAPSGNAQVTRGASLISAQDTPGLARDPTDPADLVLVDRVDRPDYSAAVQYSTDGGRTWLPSALQAPPESDYPAALALVPHKLYAPSAVFDDKGTLYVSFVTLSGSGNQPDGVWIERSNDAGQSFLPPSAVAGPHSFQVEVAVDGRSGRLFATWLQAQSFLCVLCFPTTGMPIVFSHSDDGGKTWTAPVRVSDPRRARVGSPAVAVDARGNPSVLYYDYEGDEADWGNLPGTYHGHFSLVLARSSDGGDTFGRGRVLDSAIVPPYRFLIYLAPEPAFAIGADGEMVVAWPDARSGSTRVLLRHSSDGGTSWAGPVVVNGETAHGSVQDLPAAAVAPDGRVDVLYYDASGSTVNTYLSSSGDGGRSFPTVIKVSTEPSNLQVGPQTSPYAPHADFGSRLALVSTDGAALAAWTDTRNGSSGTGKQDVYFAEIRVIPPAGSGGLVVLLAVGGGVVAVIGALVLVARRRHSRRPGRRRGPPRSDSFDMPPPPPPLVPSPGQV